MNELKVHGTKEFMGIEIPVIEGGFGENCRVVTFDSVSKIHKIPVKDVNKAINRLINKGRFVANIEYIDLFTDEYSKVTARNLGLVKSNGQKTSYILSERGYIKLIKYMDDDSSWDVMDDFVDAYFYMRKEISSTKQMKANLLLAIYDGGQSAVIASKELTKIEVQEATAPLIPKAEFHDSVAIAENCVEFGEFVATFQNNLGISFGRNKTMDWCRDMDYLCSSYNLKNKPSQQMIDSGYMKYKENVIERNGKKYVTYTPLLTGKGQIWLTKKLSEYLNRVA